MKKFLFLLLLLLLPLANSYIIAQQYAGMTGLLHVPSAEMDTIENLRLGVHAIDEIPQELRQGV